VPSKELLAALKEMGLDGLTASSSVPDQAVPRLRASGGKAVPEAKMKEAVEEPLPKSRPRKKAQEVAVDAVDASATGTPGESSTAAVVLPEVAGVDEPPAQPVAPAAAPTPVPAPVGAPAPLRGSRAHAGPASRVRARTTRRGSYRRLHRPHDPIVAQALEPQ